MTARLYFKYNDLMEKFPSPQNNTPEDNESVFDKIKTLDMDEGELVKPEPGTLEFYYQEKMRLTEELGQTKNQTDRDLISSELEEVNKITDQMATERYSHGKSGENSGTYTIPEEHINAAENLDDLKRDAA